MEVDVMKKVPVREQEPQVRAGNFEEVCYGYTLEEAQAEASRCLNCKNAQCMKDAPYLLIFPDLFSRSKKAISKKHTISFPSPLHFLQFAEEYVLRKLSVKASVSEASRERPYPSVSLKDS